MNQWTKALKQRNKYVPYLKTGVEVPPFHSRWQCGRNTARTEAPSLVRTPTVGVTMSTNHNTGRCLFPEVSAETTIWKLQSKESKLYVKVKNNHVFNLFDICVQVSGDGRDFPANLKSLVTRLLFSQSRVCCLKCSLF